MTATEQWEAAWGEYMESLERLDGLRADRFRRGSVRLYNNAKTQARKARESLRKIDAEFCERLGL
jgi:hypothetical protein